MGTEVRNSKEVQRMAKCEFCDKGVTFGIQIEMKSTRSSGGSASSPRIISW